MKLKQSNVIVRTLLYFFLILFFTPLSISLASFTAADPSDRNAPAVGISSPADGGEITAPVDVIGTVYDAGLSHYTLAYSRRGANDWTALATGSASATNAVIGRFDPTLLKNGLYDLRLSAEDFNGNQAAFTRTFLVEGELKVGLNKVAFTDLEIPVSGINLSVVRAYDSGDKRDKDFGHGWSLAVGDVDLRENRTPGDDWYEINVGSFLPRWEIRSDKAHMVAVTYPDGKTEAFDLKAEYTDPVFRTGSEVRLKYVPRYGTHSTLEALDLDFVYFNGGKIEDYDAGRAHIHYHTGAMTRRSAHFHAQMPEGFAEISPSEAQAIGPNQGDEIRLTTRRGSITAKAMITERVKPGTVFLPFHFIESCANTLTNPAHDPIVTIPEYKVCAIKLEKAA